MAFGAGVFCAVPNAAGDYAATSADGINWNAQVLPASPGGNYCAVAFGGGLFCTVPANTDVNAATSANGVAWTAQLMPAADAYLSITHNGNVFAALGCVGLVTSHACMSPTGATGSWNRIAIPSTGNYGAIGANGTQLAIIETTGFGALYSADDGATWNAAALPAAVNFYNRVAGNGTNFVAVGQDIIATSPTGAVWTADPAPPLGTWSNIKWSPTKNLYLAIDFNGQFAATSPTGLTGTWTVHNLSFTIFNLIALACNGPSFATASSNAANGMLLTP